MKTEPIGARVLVVEDDPVWCELASGWLRELGYLTESAASTSDALDCLRSQAFDVLFTDVILPGRSDGFELAVVATQLQPKLKVFFASAAAWGPSQAVEPRTTFLHKPYYMADLDATMKFVMQA